MWDPPAGFIQDVIDSTLGAGTSCLTNGGQPYYQMRLGLNSVAKAKAFACALEDVAQYMDVGFAKREAWCSEAISYWHREAEIPYPGGYRNNEWTFNWQLEDTNQLRLFYEAEEASDGRGRWIMWTELDYDNLQLGVNAPLPGAYVLISRYDETLDHEKWRGDDHSMIIDELTVYRTKSGKVDRVTATILEGDQSSQVADVRVVNDLLDATPRGEEFLSSNKKIVGFGIDLDSGGAPVSDSSRLHEITVPIDSHPSREAPMAPAHFGEDDWAVLHDPVVTDLVSFIKNLRSVGGPVVASSIEGISIEGIPDGKQHRWIFADNGGEFAQSDLEIQIDLLGDHPLPIRDILLLWSGDALPQGYRVRFASSDGDYRDAQVPQIDNALMGFNSDGTAAVPVTVLLNSAGAKVRYIEMIFPAGSLKDVRALEEMRFEYDWGAEPASSE